MENKRLKRSILIALPIVILLIVLLVPFNISKFDDGGKVMVTSLTYKVVFWRKEMTSVGYDGACVESHDCTEVFFFPDNFKSYSELWAKNHS